MNTHGPTQNGGLKRHCNKGGNIMSTNETLELLRKSEVFGDLPEDQLKHLQEIAKEVELGAHEELFQEYEVAKDVFLITSGKVALVICVADIGCRQIMEVQAGDLIGWSPLLDRSRLTDTARTLTPVNALAFDAQELLKLCEDNPHFGYEFMRRTAKVLGERLNAVRRQLVEVHGTNLPEVILESD